MNETTILEDEGFFDHYTEQQIDDWGNIFGASAGMWPWWHSIDHVTGDWDTPGQVRLSIDDPDDDRKVVHKALEPADVFAALATATEMYPWHYGRRDGLLDLDASSADLVLQVALFGEAVYG